METKVFFLKFVIIQFNFNPISDFSLVNWMTEKGLATNEPLTTAQTEELMLYTGLQPFLHDIQCDRATGQYATLTNGWNSNGN